VFERGVGELAGAQDGVLVPRPQRDLAVEHEEPLVGVAVHVQRRLVAGRHEHVDQRVVAVGEDVGESVDEPDGGHGWALLGVASQSQFYAEPKRLEKLGYLSSTKEPGRTHARTAYRLTDAGRAALREWLATPAAFPRIQNEGVIRLLGSEFADDETVLAGLRGLRAEVAEAGAWLERAAQLEPSLPHRKRALRLNRRLARRMLDAQEAWLDEVEAELGAR
jgi:DNA-binding PadR family transcriptional regulator